MNRIVVLGGGQQGRIVSEDLRAALPAMLVDTADVRPGAGTVEADLSDPAALVRLMAKYDLIVGALPARLGFQALRAAIEARRPMVDLSFCAEDSLTLDAEARRAGIPIIPDCGLAPGLSNFVVGRAVADGPVDRLTIRVGGIAQDSSRPYGYVITWSVDDLLEEYLRPARIISGGRIVEVPALSGLETVEIAGVGRLEAFYTDGLRSLLSLPVREVEEKTLRWPGHVAAIRPRVESRRLVEVLRKECTADPPRDLVVFQIVVERPGRCEETLLVDRHDGRRTAMSRTTALTCSVVTQWLARGGACEPGVRPLETFGRDAAFHTHVREALAARGVVLQTQTRSTP